jgi:hypothetical protein
MAILNEFGINPPSLASYNSAFSDMQFQRNINPHTSQDPHLAAAAAHLWAAKAVYDAPMSELQQFVFKHGVIPIYNLIKYLGFDLLTSSLPQSPGTLLATRWGQQGVTDAAKDRFGDAVKGAPPLP